jgi:hypothetical protein
MTPLYNNPGTFDELYGTTADDTDGWFEQAEYAAAASLVSDPGNPTGSGSSTRLSHQNGDGGGGAKLRRWSDLGSTLGGQGYAGGPLDVLYVSHRYYIPPGEPNGCAQDSHPFKANYYGVEGSGFPTNAGFNKVYFVPCTGEWSVQMPNAPGTQFGFVTMGYSGVGPGEEWHLEIMLVAESDTDAADGEIHIFVNGDLVPEGVITGIEFSEDGQSGFRFDGMNMYHDQGQNPTDGHVWWQRELYISGK